MGMVLLLSGLTERRTRENRSRRIVWWGYGKIYFKKTRALIHLWIGFGLFRFTPHIKASKEKTNITLHMNTSCRWTHVQFACVLFAFQNVLWFVSESCTKGQTGLRLCKLSGWHCCILTRLIEADHKLRSPTGNLTYFLFFLPPLTPPTNAHVGFMQICSTCGNLVHQVT